MLNFNCVFPSCNYKRSDIDEEEFLEHACQKAGLDKNAWKEKSTKISKFQGVIFKEESPNGNIVRESSNDLL